MVKRNAMAYSRNGWAFQGLGKSAPLDCAIRLMLDQENPSSVAVTKLANAELSLLSLRLSLRKYGWPYVSVSVHHLAHLRAGSHGGRLSPVAPETRLPANLGEANSVHRTRSRIKRMPVRA